MQKLIRFWDKIDQTFGWHWDVYVNWQKALGAEFSVISPLLRPNGKIASAYPCDDMCGCQRNHWVEHYRDDEFIAFPSDGNEESCESFKLRREDVLLHEVDMVSVWADVACALGVMALPLRFTNTTRCVQLGHMGPGRMPVYVAKGAELKQTIQELVLDNDSPFILLSANARRYGDDCDSLMRRRKALFLPISEDIGFDANGKWVVSPTLLEALQDAAGSRLQQNILVQEANGWRVVYQGETAHVPALRGMLYLCLLLESPHKVWSVEELESAAAAKEGRVGIAIMESADEDMDKRAIRDARNQVQQYQELLEEAAMLGDVERQAEIEAKRDAVLQELARSTNRGRARNTSITGEKIRAKIRRNLDRAVTAISAEHPLLGEHLRCALQKGYQPSYQPEPKVTWLV